MSDEKHDVRQDESDSDESVIEDEVESVDGDDESTESTQAEPGQDPDNTDEEPSADPAEADPAEADPAEADGEDEEPDRPRFSFVRELGRGVLGEAHEVLDEVTGENVVLKIFVRARPNRPEAFKLEFESLSRLSHPALVRFHHLVDPASDTNIAVESILGDELGLAFTQDYVDGVDLLTWLRRPATPEESAELEERRSPTTGEVPRSPDSGPVIAEFDSDAETVEADRKSESASGEIPRSDELPVADEVDEAGSDELESASIELTPDTGPSVDDEGPEAADVLAELTQPPEPASMDLKLLRLERLLPPIVEGLRHLHKFHKVHGALRPSNILVSRKGEALLTDYGIVSELVFRRPGGDEGDEVSFLEAPENIPYVAPEVMEHGLSESSDLYALGCVLFEAIAETSAFDALEWSGGKSPTLQPPPLAEFEPECPASWAEVVDGLLRRKPKERPSLGRVLEVVGAKGARAVSVPPTVIPAPESFVGRTREMEHLKELAHAAASDARVRFVLLSGETGSGKSTITNALSHHLARRGWLVIQDRCYDRESVVYQGWYQVAATIARMTESLPLAVREEIEEEVLAAAHLFPIIAGGRELSGEVSRFRAIRGLRNLLRRLSEERPILLCLEDLHWASWDTASLLVDLFAYDEGLRLLTVGTWSTDSKNAEDHLLERDLSMALIDVERMNLRGFGKEEAREYAVTMGAHLEVDEIRSVLKTANFNPRLLGELVAEEQETRQAATDLASSDKEPDPHAVLAKLYEHRIADRPKVERAIINLLAVASGPMSEKLLKRALETEVGAASLQTEKGNQASIALAELVSDGLIEKLRHAPGDEVERFIIGHDIVREVVLEALSKRDRARLAGRIADALGVHDAQNLDLRFEYELRAGRVGRAMENAVDAARRAEARFAYHRAAKLWRWLVEHRSEMPTYSRFEPADELARVEHLAGRHADAAELFRQRFDDAKSPLDKAEIRFREGRAWLQAGKVDKAIAAISEALKLTGGRYDKGMMEWVRDAPNILRAVTSKWGTDSLDKLGDDVARRYVLRGEIAFFATIHATMLDTLRRDHMGAVLANVAERTGHPQLLGYERIVLANYRWRAYDAARLARCDRWLEEADAFFLHADDHGWRAQVAAERASLHLRHDDVDGAARALSHAFDLGHRTEGDGFDRRFALYVEAQHALRVGALGAAERSARRILHVHRGDRLAESRAYEILARAALLRGDRVRAAAFLETGRTRLETTTPNMDVINWMRLSAQLDIALGRPEVAIGQIDIFIPKAKESGLLELVTARTSLYVALGQCLASNAERQRTFGDSHADDTLRRLREVRRELEGCVGDLAPVARAEVLRLFARIELLRNRTRRALRDLEQGAEAIADTHAPIDVAKSTEARGFVLLKREQPEARSVMEQAWDLYAIHECNFPLILEGWPVPASASGLREEA